MNALTPWENRLRRWVPRRPSTKLRAKLFAAPGPAAPGHEALWLRWFAPVTAALVLSVFVGANRIGPFSSFSRPATNGLWSDGRFGAAWVAAESAGVHSFHNHVSGATLAWTNEAASTSSMPLFPLLRTNYLLP